MALTWFANKTFGKGTSWSYIDAAIADLQFNNGGDDGTETYTGTEDFPLARTALGILAKGGVANYGNDGSDPLDVPIVVSATLQTLANGRLQGFHVGVDLSEADGT